VAWLTGVPTLGDLDRGRLEPPATLVYHNRNRTLSPTLGRFLQSDPNASGVGLVSSVAHSGWAIELNVQAPDLSSLVGDGTGLYEYVGSDPIGNSDPTGLFFSVPGMLTTGMSMWDMAANGMNTGAGGLSAAFGIQAATGAYGLGQSLDVDMIMDWSVPDNALSFHADNAVSSANMVLNHLGMTASSLGGLEVMKSTPSFWGGINDMLMSSSQTQPAPMENIDFKSTTEFMGRQKRHGGREHWAEIRRQIVGLKAYALKYNIKIDPNSILINRQLRDANGNIVPGQGRPDIQYIFTDAQGNRRVGVIEVYHTQSFSAADAKKYPSDVHKHKPVEAPANPKSVPPSKPSKPRKSR